MNFISNKGINKVILIGYLGKDPEVRYLQNGGSITNIIIATSEMWRDKITNEKQEKTEWHRVVFFGKISEIASNYLKKGSQIYVEGSLKTRKWKDSNGLNKYITEVIVNANGAMYMLGNNGNYNSFNSSDNKDTKIFNKNKYNDINYKKKKLTNNIKLNDNIDVPF